jgi:hypothetical protein
MEHGAKKYSILIDIKNMGIFFCVPVIIMALCGTYIVFAKYEFSEPIIMLRKGFGIFPIIGISIWIYYIFEDLLDSNGKELLLSMPYNDIDYGLFRIIKLTLVYVIMFYVFLFAILVLTLERNYVFQFQDIYFPILSIFFYSGFSFLTAVIAKNNLISFTVLGVFSVFMYSTRGGVSACIYPFQWSNPNPYYNPAIVALALIAATAALYASANFFFNNREFLMK